jgi:CBS domain-containing protein
MWSRSNRLPILPLPVVEQGKLVGIVSIGDVVKNRVEEIEREAAALRDYIQQ